MGGLPLGSQMTKRMTPTDEERSIADREVDAIPEAMMTNRTALKNHIAWILHAHRSKTGRAEAEQVIADDIIRRIAERYKTCQVRIYPDSPERTPVEAVLRCAMEEGFVLTNRIPPALAAPPQPPECKCYKTNDYDFYPAVMTGCASEWTVTEDCPIHRRTAPAQPPSALIDGPFTVRQCTGWCLEVTTPAVPDGAYGTYLVCNFGDNERRARQIMEFCNQAAAMGLKSAADRLDTVAGQCEAGGHTSRGRMLRALAKEFRGQSVDST